MLCDAETLDLVPRADEVLARAEDGELFRREMPAAQVELAAPPFERVADAAAALMAARRQAARAAEGIGVLAGAGAHPFAAPEAAINDGERYREILGEFGPIARRQLVFGLHVHVAVGGPETALAVLAGIRDRLPELAALAANAPFYAGRDTGLASIRPKLCELLPRQGIPPHLPSFEALADTLRWGRETGKVPDPGQWWWEARLHLRHGTVEVRCPDAQTTVADAAAIAAVVQALVVTLAGHHEAGEAPPRHGETWRIEENRWAACRHGVHGQLADLRTGRVRPATEALEELFEDLAPAARDLGSAAHLEHARTLAARNGADRVREAAGEGADAPGRAARWLASRFLEDPQG
jgi:glutamate---cysteine ligase / carboxylate-amine ligase